MAAGAWKFWTEAKVKISLDSGTVGIDLATGPFRMLLFDAGASLTISATTITIQSEIAPGSNEVSGGLSLMIIFAAMLKLDCKIQFSITILNLFYGLLIILKLAKGKRKLKMMKF